MPQKLQNKILRLAINHFKVDRENGVLSKLALITAEREARGHGIYIDARTLQTGLDAVVEKDGLLKGYINHPTWSESWNGEDRLMGIPGWFSGIRIDGSKLLADKFEFYESFKTEQPQAYARLLEMAEKTPQLFGLSIEAWGYAVYVAADGKEYSEAPEDTELLYNGIPAFRITDLDAAAFVTEPAANDGLFASARRAMQRQFSKADLQEIFRGMTDWNNNESESESNKNHDTTKMKKLIEALKALYKDDATRLSKALLLAANSPDPDKVTAAEIAAQLKREEDEAELVELRNKAKTYDQLKAERDDFEKKFNQIKGSGEGGELDLGAPAIVGLGKKGHTQKALAYMQAKGVLPANFAITGIGDLWIPEIWIPGMAEETPVGTDFFGSGVVVRNPVLDAAAQAGGTQVDVPFFRRPQFADEPQVQGTGPTINGLGSGRMVSPRLSRVNTLGNTAFAAGLSGADPIGFALASMQGMRSYNQLIALIYMLRGLFGTSGAAAYTTLLTAAFSETGAAPTSDQLFDSDLFYTAAGKLSELKGNLENGAMLIHPDIETSLSMQNTITYEKPSEGSLMVRMYKKTIPVYTSKLLVRAGTTSGKVYDTYIFAPATVGEGYKTQTNKVGDIASMVMKEDAHLNELTVYDRTSGFVAPNGARWTGTPANAQGGPTNAELATQGNWALGYQSPENVGIVCIKTNG